MNEKEQLPMTEKENVRWRVANAHIDPDNYVFYPAKKQVDYYDNDNSIVFDRQARKSSS